MIDIVESEQASEHDRLLPDVADALRGLAASADLMLLSARRNAALLERQLVSLDLLKFFPIWETVSPLGGSAIQKHSASYITALAATSATPRVTGRHP